MTGNWEKVMGWIAAILASGPARKALGLLLAATTITLFILNAQDQDRHRKGCGIRLWRDPVTRLVSKLEAERPRFSGGLVKR